MFGSKRKTPRQYPAEVATTLEELMRFEYLVNSRRLMQSRPVYSILAGQHASKLRGRGLDFEEARKYVAGDDIRNIDWRVTARTGQVYSKVFDEEKERPAFIVLDQSAWMFFGSKRFVKTVSGAHAAAIAAFYTLKRGDRAGGIVFNEQGADVIASRRSRANVQSLLQCIVNRNNQAPDRTEIKPDTGLLNRALRHAMSVINHDYVVTVISDFTNIDDETKKYLRTISYHNDLILIHIYDEMDVTLPGGNLLIGNGVRQVLLKNTKRSPGSKYESAFRDLQKHLNEEFTAHGIPIVFFNTSDPIEDQIRKNVVNISALKSKK